MPNDFHHGVRVIETDTGTRPIRTVSTAIIGMVCTADDADPTVFPLNTLVQLVGANRYLNKAGTTGTLRHALDAIKDQCEPLIYVCRVAQGKTEAETTANVIGSVVDGRKTGLQALLSGKQMFGAKPRILGAPGLDKVQAVANELAVIAQKLRAFAYVGVNATNIEAAVNYRENFGSKRLMLIWPDFTGFDTTTSAQATLWASARALGLRAKIDNDIGWHKTLSNIEVSGVEGITHDVYWDLQESATDANYLNSNEVTTLIRASGFRFWGNRTCSADPLFAFESYTRTGDVLADTVAEAHLWAVDKPISEVLFKDILYGIRSKLDELTTNGYLLGGDAWFDPDFNPKEAFKAGKIKIHYNYTPVPPAEDITFVQVITDEYIVDLTNAVAGL